MLGQGGTREEGGQGREERREGSLLAMSDCREAREVKASWALYSLTTQASSWGCRLDSQSTVTWTLFHCTVLYCTVLYGTVLYCTGMYWTGLL